MTAYARAERLALTDLMIEQGPDAPTCCEGWTVRDLAAHLVLRERRLDAAPGILIGPLRGYTAQVQRRLRDRPWPALVETVRSGPPALLEPLDAKLNLVEMFLHHEDVRRARQEWQPRQLDAEEERALWARLGTLAKLVGRRLPVGVELQAPGFGLLRAGRGEARVTVSGPPGELLLFVSGRQDVARVSVEGPPDAVEQLETARLGL